MSGAGGNGRPVTDVQAVDVATGSAIVVSQLPGSVTEASAFAVRGAIFLAGGVRGGIVQRGVFRLDPASGALTPVASLPEARADAGVGQIADTTYLIGGEGPSRCPLSCRSGRREGSRGSRRTPGRGGRSDGQFVPELVEAHRPQRERSPVPGREVERRIAAPGVGSQLEPHPFADLVGDGLGGPAEIPVDLAVQERIGFPAVLEHERQRRLVGPALTRARWRYLVGVHPDVDDDADGAGTPVARR